MSQMSRRRFVTSGTALAALTTSRPIRATAERFDVVIIGAGLSGLKAAHLLKSQGASVAVLEASHRVGGRVKTADGALGALEFGGNEIGPHYARVRDMCSQLGLDLVPSYSNLTKPFCFSIRDQLIRAADWEKSPVNLTVGDERKILPFAWADAVISKNNPLKTLEDWRSPDFAKYDVAMSFLVETGYSPEAVRLFWASSPDGNPVSTSTLDLYQEATRTKFESSKEGVAADVVSARVRGGNSRLPEAIAKSLDGAVRLGKPVTRIHCDKSGATVTCLDRSVFEAKFVIAAIPLTLMRDVLIEPQLPPVHNEAIQLTPYGNTHSGYLEVVEPFWDNDGFDPSLFTDGPIKLFMAQGEADGSVKRFRFMAIGLIANTLDTLSDAEYGDFVVAELVRLRPASKGKVKFLGAERWGREPFQKGCRHLFAPGQLARYLTSLQQPWLQIHFAGEHTRTLEFGMEAAMESGERAAIEVLTRLG